MRPFLDRFWEKAPETDGCWLWMAARSSYGYGVFQVRRRVTMPAHRLAYMLATGEHVADTDVVCHHCDTPSCIRPDHLFVGSQRDNMRDMIAKGRKALVVRPPGETCSRGHRYDYRRGRQSVCRTCRRESEFRRRHNNGELRLAR